MERVQEHRLELPLPGKAGSTPVIWGVLHCLDAKTGTELYVRCLHADHYRASPILAAGRVYLIARGGTVSVVKAGRNFELLAANTLDDNFTASPAVASGRLYLRGFRSLYAIGEGRNH